MTIRQGQDRQYQTREIFFWNIICFQDDLFQSYRFPDDKDAVSLRGLLRAMMFCGTLLVKQLKNRHDMRK